LLEEQDLPENFQIVSETCGIETARILIKELGGITVSIPMVNSLRSLIERYIKENIFFKNFVTFFLKKYIYIC